MQLKCRAAVAVWCLQVCGLCFTGKMLPVNKYTPLSYSSTGLWRLTLHTGFPAPHALLSVFPSLGENNSPALLPALPTARSGQWWEALGSISQVPPSCAVSEPARNSAISSLKIQRFPMLFNLILTLKKY